MPASPRQATQRKSAGADEDDLEGGGGGGDDESKKARGAGGDVRLRLRLAGDAVQRRCAGWCGGALGACGRRLDDGRAGNLLVTK